MKKSRLTILAFCLSLSAFAADKKSPYNLLVIQTDEHHFKTLGCYGGKIVKTPNIDWIAKNGAIATSFLRIGVRSLKDKRCIALARYKRTREKIAQQLVEAMQLNGALKDVEPTTSGVPSDKMEK